MKRRKFIDLLTISGVLPLFFAFIPRDVHFDELIGKKKPDLFGEGYQLRKSPADALERMKKDTLVAGFKILTISSYRSFDDQKRIWNNKYLRFTKEGSSPEEAIGRIIEYSTIPGTSRHHWGTDIDIVDGSKDVTGDRLLPNLFQPGKPYGELKGWLNQNADKYGFVEVYTNQSGRKGFKYEPWHFSYKPLSEGYLKKYKTVGFRKLLKGLDIHGSKYFSDSFIQQYWNDNMMDINPELKP